MKQNPAIPLAAGGGLVGLMIVWRLLRGGRGPDTVILDLKRGRARTL